MRDLLFAVGTLTGLVMIGAWIAGIWFGDTRWGGTGFTLIPVVFVVFCVASFMPAPVRHADKCGGC